MKKYLIATLAAIAVLGLLAVLSGCGTSATANSSELSKDTYDKISVGATSDSLKSIAGEPAKTETKNMSGGHSMSGGTMNSSMSIDYWYYQGSQGWVRFDIAENIVTAKSGY